MRRSNIHGFGIPKVEKREKGVEIIFENMNWYYHQATDSNPNRLNIMKHTLGYITVTITVDQRQNLKNSQRKKIHYI